jgi:hypothetical protein
MPKISLKPIGDILVVVDTLNKEEVENLLMNPGVDLLPAELAQIVLALGKIRRLVVVPGVNQRKAQGVCEHAGVIDDLQRSLEHLVPELDIQQPYKLSQGLQVRVLLILVFELEFGDDFVELAVKGDEEGDLLD